MGKKVLILIMFLSVIIVAPFVFGASANFLVDSGSTQQAITDTTNVPYNTSTASGNVSIATLTGTIQTLHYAGFLGNITIQKGLYGVVGVQQYAMFSIPSNSTTIDAIAATTDAEFAWNTLQTVTGANANLCLNVSATSSDSVNNVYANITQTYSGVSSFLTKFLNGEVRFQASAIASYPDGATMNWPSSIGADGSSPCPGNTGLDNLVFLANYNSTVGNTWYNNVTANYQLLVGVNETDDTADTPQDIKFSFFVVNP